MIQIIRINNYYERWKNSKVTIIKKWKLGEAFKMLNWR